MPAVAAFVAKIGAIAIGQTTVGAIVGQVVVGMAASRLLAPKISRKRMGQGASQGVNSHLLSSRTGIANACVVYGRARKGGTVVYLASAENGAALDLVIALCNGPVEAIDAIYFDGVEAINASGVIQGKWSGKVTVEKVLGVTEQSFEKLIAQSGGAWTHAHKMSGVAAIALRLTFDNEAFPNGLPNVTVDIRGKNDIFDPRINKTSYSENAALCLANYVASEDGLNAPIGGDDGINQAALIEAANICDETVTLSDGTVEKRYTCNGILELGGTTKTNIEELLTALAGRFVTKNGQFYIQAGAYRIPSVSITDDHILGGITVKTRLSRADLFNGVKGVYVSPENKWVLTDYPAYASETYKTEDGERIWQGDYDLPFTISASMAQRLAKIELELSRRQMSVSLSVSLATWGINVGDCIYLTHSRWGWDKKVFYIYGLDLNFKDGALVFDLSLREISPLVYSWTASEEKITAVAPATNLPDFTTISPPGTPVLAEFMYETRAGVGVRVALDISWAASSSPVVSYYEVEAKAPGAADWTPVGTTSGLKIEKRDVSKGTWTVRVRAVSLLNLRSVWGVSEISVSALAAPPVKLTGVNIQEQNSDTALLSWDLPAELDVRVGGRIAVRHTVSQTPTWENSLHLTEISGAMNSIVVPLKKGTYLIAPRDSSLNLGPFASVSTSGLTAFNFTLLNTLQEGPNFSGTKTDLINKDGAGLTLKTTTAGGILRCVPFGFYTFANTIELSRITQFRMTSIIEKHTVDLQDLIDARTDKMDSWPSFDGAVGAETNVSVEIRTTQDGPGANRVWSDWQRLDTRGITARAVKARAVLEASGDRFAPLVTKLEVKSELVNVSTT